MLDSVERIKIDSNDGEVLYSTVGVDDGDTIRTDEGVDLHSTIGIAFGTTLDAPDGTNPVMLERLALGVPLGSTDELVLGSDEGVKFGYTS